MDRINQIWPKWHTVELIGRGAFGEVYKAKREEMGAVFYSAVKVISIPHDETEIRKMLEEGHTNQSIRYYYESIAKDLMNEINVLEILKSAGNIVNIEEFEIREKTEEIGWEVYIRMELLKNLNKYRQEKNLGCEDVAKLGMDICKALQYCEQSHIIHRDIKPSNIFVDVYGNYKLGDFGIARQMERTQSTLSQKGTEMYMAPEVRLGKSGSSYNVDIYSLGLVMYRLLNRNKMPFEPAEKDMITYQEKEEAMLRRMRGETLPLPADAPPELGRIILRACETDPKRRYQSAERMYADLAEWQRAEKAVPGKGKKADDEIVSEKIATGQNGSMLNKKSFTEEETVSAFSKSFRKTEPEEEKRAAAPSHQTQKRNTFDVRKNKTETEARIAGTTGNSKTGQTYTENRNIGSKPLPKRGDNVFRSCFIDKKTAKNGGKIYIQDFNGKNLEVEVPRNSYHGIQLRLQGRGKPGSNGGENGDLIVQLNILNNKKTSSSASGYSRKEKTREKYNRGNFAAVSSKQKLGPFSIFLILTLSVTMLYIFGVGAVSWIQDLFSGEPEVNTAEENNAGEPEPIDEKLLIELPLNGDWDETLNWLDENRYEYETDVGTTSDMTEDMTADELEISIASDENSDWDVTISCPDTEVFGLSSSDVSFRFYRSEYIDSMAENVNKKLEENFSVSYESEEGDYIYYSDGANEYSVSVSSDSSYLIVSRSAYPAISTDIITELDDIFIECPLPSEGADADTIEAWLTEHDYFWEKYDYMGETIYVPVQGETVAIYTSYDGSLMTNVRNAEEIFEALKQHYQDLMGTEGELSEAGSDYGEWIFWRGQLGERIITLQMKELTGEIDIAFETVSSS